MPFPYHCIPHRTYKKERCGEAQYPNGEGVLAVRPDPLFIYLKNTLVYPYINSVERYGV